MSFFPKFNNRFLFSFITNPVDELVLQWRSDDFVENQTKDLTFVAYVISYDVKFL